MSRLAVTIPHANQFTLLCWIIVTHMPHGNFTVIHMPHGNFTVTHMPHGNFTVIHMPHGNFTVIHMPHGNFTGMPSLRSLQDGSPAPTHHNVFHYYTAPRL